MIMLPKVLDSSFPSLYNHAISFAEGKQEMPPNKPLVFHGQNAMAHVRKCLPEEESNEALV